MNYLKEVVYVDIGPISGIPVGTISEYINLNEAETAKLLYQGLNRNRPATRCLSIAECTEYAQEIRNGVLSKASCRYPRLPVLPSLERS